MSAIYLSVHKQQFTKIGLELREGKCEAYSLLPIEGWSLPIDVQYDGLVILGVLVRSDSFVVELCKQKTYLETTS